MVYFHGGDFFEGATDEVDGRRLAVDDNVIVVSAAYRLGPLGFLAHPDMRRGEGNLGLLDQRAALVWVQEHIHAFNGYACARGGHISVTSRHVTSWTNSMDARFFLTFRLRFHTPHNYTYNTQGPGPRHRLWPRRRRHLGLPPGHPPPGQHHQDDAGATATITHAAIVESGACYALPLGTFHCSAGLFSRGAG